MTTPIGIANGVAVCRPLELTGIDTIVIVSPDVERCTDSLGLWRGAHWREA
jgi:hypothetical protein